MSRRMGGWRIAANAAVAAGIVGVAGFGLDRVARRHWQAQPTFHARAEFARVAGLEPGDRVRIQGMDAGVVESILPPSAPGRPVCVVLRIGQGLRGLIRVDATASILSTGVVGGKVVEIAPGRADASPIADEGMIRSEAPVELGDIIAEARGSLRRLNEVADRASAGLDGVDAVVGSIRRGQGTLGRLVRDDDAYRRLLSLSERGQRAFAAMEDDLDAIKRTWPLSNYFESRAFYDRDGILYRPGADREERSFAESDLFEPGRAVLTTTGRARLDEVARWFASTPRPKSTEVVIAAFTDGVEGSPDLARILTQEQAGAVRAYLVKRHAIDAVGWTGSRKVAAVGFGVESPTSPGGRAAPAARRVEILVFTPRA